MNQVVALLDAPPPSQNLFLFKNHLKTSNNIISRTVVIFSMIGVRMKKAKAYFAHSKKIYNTDEEAAALKYLRKKYSHVTCPNNDIGELGSMAPYLTIVNHHDIVIAKEWDGFVGRGVHAELMYGKETYVLKEKDGKYSIKPIKKITIVNDGKDWYRYARIN